MVLFSNSLLAYRIHSYSYKHYQEPIPIAKMIVVVPTAHDITWPPHISVPLKQISDGKFSC